MVDLLVYVSLGLSLLSLSALLLLIRYLPGLRVASKVYKEASQVVSSMMGELNSRASVQDRRLADAQVKLDVLEDRWIRSGWGSLQVPVSYRSSSPRLDLNMKEATSLIARGKLEAPRLVPAREFEAGVRVTSSRLSKVEFLVLGTLANRRMTAPEVRGVLGSSREHAARVMKSLADRGLVERDSSKKPYTYELSDLGRDIITNRSPSDLT